MGQSSDPYTHTPVIPSLDYIDYPVFLEPKWTNPVHNQDFKRELTLEEGTSIASMIIIVTNNNRKQTKQHTYYIVKYSK